MQGYENRNWKNILSDAKEMLNDHDSILVEYFDYVIQEKQLNFLHVTGKKQKLCSKQS